jgi:hypothetical protein
MGVETSVGAGTRITSSRMIGEHKNTRSGRRRRRRAREKGKGQEGSRSHPCRGDRGRRGGPGRRRRITHFLPGRLLGRLGGCRIFGSLRAGQLRVHYGAFFMTSQHPDVSAANDHDLAFLPVLPPDIAWLTKPAPTPPPSPFPQVRVTRPHPTSQPQTTSNSDLSPASPPHTQCRETRAKTGSIDN